MHFADSAFIFLLALILFGPKRLPEIGRQVGRLMMEFRRASNEFKMQMNDELRALEEEDRRKKLDAIEAQTGTISEPNALPSAVTQAETLTNAEADPDYPPQPYTPPLPDEECIDPVDLLDGPQADEPYDYSHEYGPEIYSPERESIFESATEPVSEPASGASYHPSDEPSTPVPGYVQPENTTHEKPITTQDTSQEIVRPESDPAPHHA